MLAVCPERVDTRGDRRTGFVDTNFLIFSNYHFCFFEKSEWISRKSAPIVCSFKEKVYFCSEKRRSQSMWEKANTIDKLRSTREYLRDHYGVSSMLLFGSLAKNEQQEGSDVDVCVEMRPNLFTQAGVKSYLQQLLGCDVDVVRMRSGMNALFKSQILKYGIRIY